jgi:ABC-type transport system involved in cytochrome c biogenesis permease subunit
MNDVSRYVPWAVTAVAALYLALTAMPPADGEKEPHLQELAGLPVLDGGRIKPLDTYARTNLMVISSRTSYRDTKGNTQPAVKWVMDCLAVGLANYYDTVSVEDPEMLAWLDLSQRQRFEVRAIQEKLATKRDELDRLAKLPAEKLEPLQRKKLRLDMEARVRDKLADDIHEHLSKEGDVRKAPVVRIENDQVLTLLGLERREGLRYSPLEIFQSKYREQFEKKVRQAQQRGEKERDLVDVKALEVWRHLGTYLELGNLSGVTLVPSAASKDDWNTLRGALNDPQDYPAARSWQRMVHAYGTGDAKAFNKELADYRSGVEKQMPEEARTARLEVWFNNFSPFYQCTVLYVFVFLLACASWAWAPDVLRRSAFWLGVLTLAVHSLALLARMYLQGRPPVTNLYSSAVFIGWGGVLCCLVLEAIFRNGISLVVGAWEGFATLIIAHHLGGSGDTLEMMQAVLDTNFWLATHVTCVTIGYLATFVAGFLGIVYVLLGLFTTALNKELNKTLGQMVYGVVCFATLFSFVGTVLGGIWADQSWGRFWGWDPKENGAILIVIMNALILHARWGGMVKERGMALLAIAGNMVTAWSWFGTNQLGVGLHAYGFNNTLATGCSFFWVSQLAVIGAGLVPVKYWRSFGAKPLFTPQLAPAGVPALPPSPAAPAAIKPGPGKGKKGKGKRGNGGIQRRPDGR